MGQGIAGSILAFRCIERGERVIIIDKGLPSASSLSFGLINPITGRKYVKSWMVETLLKEAKKTYGDLEAFFKTSFYDEIEIVRVFNDGIEEEFWLLRSDEPGYAHYLSDEQFSDIDRVFKDSRKHGIVKNCLHVNMPKVLTYLRQWLIDQNSYRQKAFDHSQLIIRNGNWIYLDIEAKKVIFCEGTGTVQNPFFQGLPVLLSKGDILILAVPGYPNNLIVKNKYFTIPISDNKIWFGVVNSFTDLDPNPNKIARETLLAEWEKRYDLPMRIVEHHAAFRLAVKDRRPIIGRHQDHENMYIFSGMGTKGASLVPYFANMLLDWIAGEGELLELVNLRRFKQS